ncbi:protein of unknown function [Shewanella benthica]|uniref:Uncharacterized protein n=1 Tax=Shewanella benthica TaxID=43661 RepID=A0A330M3T9_9GAMM|nr:protein of unknown function [Shewanella benthica]
MIVNFSILQKTKPAITKQQLSDTEYSFKLELDTKARYYR